MLTKEEKNYIDYHYENILKILYKKDLLKKEELLEYIINCGLYSNNISDKAKLLNNIYSIKSNNKSEGKKQKKTKQKNKAKKQSKKTKQKKQSKKTKQKNKAKKQSKKTKQKNKAKNKAKKIINKNLYITF